MKEKLIRNTVSSGVASFVTMGINFFLTPYMIIKLGVVEYGLIGMASIFMIGGYVSLVEMGFQSSISKYVAEYNVRNDSVKITEIVFTLFAIFFCIGLFMMLAGILLSGVFVNGVLKIPEGYHLSLKTALMVVSSSYLFQFPNFIVVGFLQGMQRYDILRTRQVLITVIYSLGVVLMLLYGCRYVTVIAFQTFMMLVQFSLNFNTMIRYGNFLGLKTAYFSLKSLKDVFNLTKYLFVGKVSNVVFYNTHRIFVGIFLGPVFMTYYDAINKVSSAIKTALGFVNSAVMPAASELYAASRMDSVKKLFTKTLLYQIVAVYPVTTGIMLLSGSFLKLWLGPEFVMIAPLLVIALVYNLITPYMNVGGSILVGMNREIRYLTILNIATTVLNVVISFFLIRNYKLYGVFIGLSSSTFIAAIFYMRLFFREFDVRPYAFMKNILRIFALGIIPLVAVYALGTVAARDNFLTLLLKGGIWCLAYWLLLYKYVFDNEDRNLVLGLGKNLGMTLKG